MLLPALPRLLRISLRFIVRLVLWSLPFAALLGAIYLGMLGQHDINFYLAESPPVFRWAVVLAALVLVGHLLTVARIATGWRLKAMAEPIIVRTGADTPEAIAATKRVAEAQLQEARALGMAMATGLALGVF